MAWIGFFAREALRPRNLALIASLSTGTALCYYGPDADSVERLARWQERWEAGKIMFHKSSVHSMLVSNYDVWCPDETAHRVFVPLCGKTVDMSWLAAKGHEVVGVEGVIKAIEEFAAEHDHLQMRPASAESRKAEFIRADRFTGELPGYVFKNAEAGLGYYIDKAQVPLPVDFVSEGLLPGPRHARTPVKGGVWLRAQDYFTVTRKQVGSFKRAWDRGSLVAIPPAMREDYVRILDSLMEPGGRILLSTFDYDQTKAPGPPFAANVTEVQRLFPQYDVYLLARLSVAEEFRQRKGTQWERIGKMDELTFLLRKRRPLWLRILWPWPLGGRDQRVDLGD